MTSNPTCFTCRFREAREDQQTDMCRQRPPTTYAFPMQGRNALGMPAMQTMTITVWAEVRSSDWCGQHSTSLTLSS